MSAPLSRPALRTGFAPRDMEPLYPELWDGCQLAWCPALGPTGSTLFDFAPRKRHGTGAGLTLDTAWAPRYGYQCLTTDGTDDFVTLSTSITVDEATISVWFALHQKVTWQRIVDGKNDSGFWVGRNGSTDSIGGGFGAQNSPFGVFAAYTLGTFILLTITRSVAGVNTLYINGVAQAGTYTGNTGARTISTVAIGGNQTTSPGNERSNASYAGLMLHSRALKANEIKLMYERGPLSPCMGVRRPRQAVAATGTDTYLIRRRPSGLLTRGL